MHLLRQGHGFLPCVRLAHGPQVQPGALDDAAYRLADDVLVVRDQQAWHPYSSGPEP